MTDRRVLRLDSTDSTNEEAKRRATAGAPDGLWVVADEQTAGRGRRGRAWVSQKGNLFCSILLRPDGPPEHAAQLGFAAGLAVAETFDRWADPALVRLKWPNDALIAGRKACGILLEAGGGEADRWLVAGIGLNLASAPETGLYPTTCLADHMGAAPPAPERAFERLAAAFETWLARWRAEGFAPLRTAWLARAAGLGEAVTARLPDRELTGTFENLDADGALILRGPHGARLRVTAGDVFFPASTAATG